MVAVLLGGAVALLVGIPWLERAKRMAGILTSECAGVNCPTLTERLLCGGGQAAFALLGVGCLFALTHDLVLLFAGDRTRAWRAAAYLALLVLAAASWVVLALCSAGARSN